MNNVNFLTQPSGFPLDANLLDFLQAAWKTGISAVAGVTGIDGFVLSGMEDDGTNVAPGYFFFNGEPLYFEGGQKQSTFDIVEIPEALANQSGTFVDRKITKLARFIASPAQGAYGYFAVKRLPKMDELGRLITAIANMGIGVTNAGLPNGSNSQFLVVSGCKPNTSGHITDGIVLYQNTLLSVPTYNANAVTETNPVWLDSEGNWTTTAPTGNVSQFLKFEPYTTRRVEDVMFRNQQRSGTVIWQALNGFSETWFEASGLGRWKFDGWAKANGNNGTEDFASAIPNLIPIQKL